MSEGTKKVGIIIAVIVAIVALALSYKKFMAPMPIPDKEVVRQQMQGGMQQMQRMQQGGPGGVSGAPVPPAER